MQSYHYAHSQRAPRVPSRHHINATTIMRLHIKYLLGCLALLFLLPACKGESDVEEATLDLSAQSVTFTKDGGEQTLTVSTNKDSWYSLHHRTLLAHRRAAGEYPQGQGYGQ